MDRLIKRFDAVEDSDLMLCEHRGVAYQKDMGRGRVEYGSDYLAKVAAYDGTTVARAVNAGRCDLLKRHLPPGSSVLDWGAGTGAFAKAAISVGFEVSAHDLNPYAQLRLTANSIVSASNPHIFDAVTMWDTIEHMEQSEQVLRAVHKDAYFFASIPVFDDLKKIRASKHYRPGEHLYYWTVDGFRGWMSLYGFRLVDYSDHEIEAGRESIGAFAFRKDLPNYHDHIAAYKEIHSTKHYGNSATEEYLDIVAKVVRDLKPKSILDFGCGRSDLAPHFWLDGQRTIARYDPAISAFKRLPEGRFDIVFCMDVMEHVLMVDVDQIFAEIKTKSQVVLMSISTLPARAKLPDGRNAHVTLLSKSEWIRWLKNAFFSVRILPAKHAHELVVLLGAGE